MIKRQRIAGGAMVKCGFTANFDCSRWIGECRAALTDARGLRKRQKTVILSETKSFTEAWIPLNGR